MSITEIFAHTVGAGRGRCGSDKQLETIQYIVVDVKCHERKKQSGIGVWC